MRVQVNKAFSTDGTHHPEAACRSSCSGAVRRARPYGARGCCGSEKSGGRPGIERNAPLRPSLFPFLAGCRRNPVAGIIVHTLDLDVAAQEIPQGNKLAPAEILAASITVAGTLRV